MSFDEQKQSLMEISDNPNTKIKNFAILDDIKNIDNFVYIYVNIEYMNGTIEQNLVSLKSTEGKYIIQRGSADHIILKQGENVQSIQPRIQLASWYASTSYSDRIFQVYTNIFSSSSSYVQVNYQSYGRNNFRVVKYGDFNDEDISYSANVERMVGSSSYVTLNLIPGKSFSNVKLRIMSLDSGNLTFGEVYSY